MHILKIPHTLSGFTQTYYYRVNLTRLIFLDISRSSIIKDEE
nr:MAG TPA: hypothetical protein [Caudoviricetes sp.]